MIIVEGPDGAGKTTLVDEICQTFSLERGERGTSDRSKLYEVVVPDTYRAITDAVKASEPARVWDRIYYSELVYYPITTGKSQFSSGQRRLIERLIADLEIPVILCIPPLQECMDNVANDTDPAHKKFNDALPQVYEGYHDIMAFMPEHTLVYDYTQEPSPQRILDAIEEYLNMRLEREW